MVEEANGANVSFERLMALREHGRLDRRDVGASVSQPGGFAGRRRGSGLEIHDVRPYALGDDLRYTDPGVTARTGRLHVRTFHAEEDRAALLLADFRAPMLWGTRTRLRSVAAAEALAVVGWRIVQSGGKVGLLAARNQDADYLAPRERERAMIRLAATLERSHRLAVGAQQPIAPTQNSAPPPLQRALERAGRLVPPGATVVCATGLDAPGDTFDKVAGWLAQKRRLVVLLVLDALEAEPPREPLSYYGDDGVITEGRLDAGASVEERVEALTKAGATVQIVRADEDVAHLDVMEAVG